MLLGLVLLLLLMLQMLMVLQFLQQMWILCQQLIQTHLSSVATADVGVDELDAEHDAGLELAAAPAVVVTAEFDGDNPVRT